MICSRTRLAIIGLVVLAYAAVLPVTGRPIVAFQRTLQATDQRVAHSGEDLKNLAKEIPKRHKILVFKISKREIDSAVDALAARLPALTDDQIITWMMRVTALV